MRHDPIPRPAPRRRERRFAPALLLAALLLAGTGPASAAPHLDFLDLSDCPVSEAARLITSLTGETVVVTEGARSKTVDVLIEGLAVEAALKVICRSAGLVYRYDAEANLYTVLELEEYQRTALEDSQGPMQTHRFKVGAANLTQIASAIQQLFGLRVIVSAGEAIEDFRESPGQAGGGHSSRTQRVYGFDGAGGVGRTPTSFNRSQANFGAGAGILGVQGAQIHQPGIGSGGGAFGGSAHAYGDPRLASRQGLPTQGDAFGGLAGEISSEDALSLEVARARGDVAASAEENRVRRARESGEPPIFLSLNHEHSLLLVRTADASALEEIARLVADLDIAVPQVILEMKILQLDVGDGLTAGVSFEGNTLVEKFGVRDRHPVTGEPVSREFLGNENALGLGNFATEPAATLAYRLLSDQIRARVDLLASDNRVEVVATPVLIATNNRAAQIEVGEERIITVGASTDQITSPLTGAVQTIIRTETEKRTIGIVLDILPRINDDGTVTLSVYQESTNLKPANNTIQVGSETVLIDSVDTANVDATVVARDGHTIAVGGLIRSENTNHDTKVPILGDIPILGNAFQRKDRGSRKTEIILLITPHLLQPGDDATERSRQLAARLSDHRWNVGGEAIVEQDNPELRRYRRDATKGHRRLTGDPDAVPEKTEHWNEIAPPSRQIPFFLRDKEPPRSAAPAPPAFATQRPAAPPAPTAPPAPPEDPAAGIPEAPPYPDGNGDAYEVPEKRRPFSRLFSR